MTIGLYNDIIVIILRRMNKYMVALVFCTIVPCVFGSFLTLFMIFGIHYTVTGQEIVPFFCRITDWLDTASDAVSVITIIGMVMVGAYCVYAGLVYLGNFRFFIGEPEECTISFNIMELYDNKLRVDVSSSEDFSFLQILMGLWNYVLLPILAFVLISALGWLVFIIQLIRHIRGSIEL